MREGERSSISDGAAECGQARSALGGGPAWAPAEVGDFGPVRF